MKTKREVNCKFSIYFKVILRQNDNPNHAYTYIFTMHELSNESQAIEIK